MSEWIEIGSRKIQLSHLNFMQRGGDGEVHLHFAGIDRPVTIPAGAEAEEIWSAPENLKLQEDFDRVNAERSGVRSPDPSSRHF